MANRITNAYNKEFAKPRGLYITASGGAMMYDVKTVILKFVSYDPLTVDQARKLYVEMMEELLCRFNENEKLRPYLHNYPFELENYELTIFFKDNQRKRRVDGFVTLMFHCNDNLYFEGYDIEKDDFYPIHDEPYEESRRIVQEAKQDFDSE